MKIVVASCSDASRLTRFGALNRARVLIALVVVFVLTTISASYAQQVPNDSGASAGNASSTESAGSSNAADAQGARNASNAQNKQNPQNAQNGSANSQGASTHSADVAGEQIAPFFQIATNPNSPIVGEPLTILRLVYGIYSPAERSRRLVAYWELSERCAYYNLCSVYRDFVNQCSQKVESTYPSGKAPQETSALLNSLRLVAEQRCEDARLTFLQAQYDFDASFTSPAGRRAAMARAAYSDGGSKAIGWGGAVLYVPSARPATEFYNARFEENARFRSASKEAARLNAQLPLLYESLQSRANQAIREKDVLIGLFNASTISATALFGALDRYFEAQRDALEAAIRYNQAIAFYVAETTPGYVQGERFLATLNQRVENASQKQSDEKKTNDAQNPNAPAQNTSARRAFRSSDRFLPGLEYEEPTREIRYAATYRAPGMDRWYYPGFDDESISRPTTFANDPSVDSVFDSVFDARVGGQVETQEQSLVPSLASSGVSSASEASVVKASSDGSVGLQPAVYSTAASASSASPSVETPATAAPSQVDAQDKGGDSNSTNAPPSEKTTDESSAQPSQTDATDGGVSPESAPKDSSEEAKEPEKPRVVAFFERRRVGIDEELFRFFEETTDEVRERSSVDFPRNNLRIVRGQTPDPNEKKGNEADVQKPGASQNRVSELARALFSPSEPEQEAGQVLERTCSLAETLMRVPNSPNARFAAVDAYWNLQRATARLRVETTFLATLTRAFNDANAANSESTRLFLAAALGAQARAAEAKSIKRSLQIEALRLSNQSAEYGYPLPSTLPFFGLRYELGVPIPENVHTRRSGELIRSRLNGLESLSVAIPTSNDAFSLDVASITDCDALVALETLEKKRESLLLFIDSIIDLNESIAEYVSYFPAFAPNERFVEALVGRN